MTNKQMIDKIEYEIGHGEGDTGYKVVRIGDILQYIKDCDDSFCDMQDIPEVIKLFDLWRNCGYPIGGQSTECIEFVYNLIK